jgi:hypothetical protein
MKASNPALALVLPALVFGGAITALVVNKRNQAGDRQQLEEQLFGPYFRLIAGNQLDEAWQRFTTADYQRQYPLERYREHYAATLRELGRVTGHRFDAVNRAHDLTTGKSGWNLTVVLQLERGSKKVIYAARRDGGTIRIDAASTFVSNKMAGLPTPW